MDIGTLRRMIMEGIPDADLEIQDLAGDGDHYHVRVRSALFQGKTRVQQHQMVYQSLGGRVGKELHALALETETIEKGTSST